MGDGQGDVTPGDGEEWVSLGEAARRLGVTRAAIYGRIERRTLTTRPKGNRVWRCCGHPRNITLTVRVTLP
jgi:hypothetical protein